MTYDESLAERLTAAVSRKLGVKCEFSHWINRATGDVPVFKIPDPSKASATEIGLTFA